MSNGYVLAKSTEGLLIKCLKKYALTDEITLFVNGDDQSVQLVHLEKFPTKGNIRHVVAILGIITLKSNRYIVFADKVEEAGIVEDNIVYKNLSTSVECCKTSSSIYFSDAEEKLCLKLLKNHLNYV